MNEVDLSKLRAKSILVFGQKITHIFHMAEEHDFGLQCWCCPTWEPRSESLIYVFHSRHK